MTSRDQLITPTSGNTEVGYGESDRQINNFKPLYPGKRNSVAPADNTPLNPSQTMMVPLPDTAIALKKADTFKNAKSMILDRSEMDKSLGDFGKNNTDPDNLSDEEIIPEDEKWKSRKCFWQMNEQVRIKWDLFVMILATWNCFSIPFNVAFEPDFMTTIWMDLFNAVIDILFMIDVIINFRTSYINSKTGEEIFDLKLIAKNYMKGRFWIDILASLPMDVITLGFSEEQSNTIIFELFGLLKLVRVLRLSRIIMYMNLKDDIKMSLKLVKLVFFLVMYIHVQA